MSFNLRNVLISDEVDDKCVDILRSNGIEVVKNTKFSKDQLISEIPVSVCVCMRVGVYVLLCMD